MCACVFRVGIYPVYVFGYIPNNGIAGSGGHSVLCPSINSILLCVYHIFFIHLFLDGHLGQFHIFAIVNSAEVNMGVHLSL